MAERKTRTSKPRRAATLAGDPDPAYSIADLIRASQALLGVPDFVAAGALQGTAGPLTASVAQAQVASWLGRAIASDLPESQTNKDQPGGYAGLDSGGKLSASGLPPQVVTGGHPNVRATLTTGATAGGLTVSPSPGTTKVLEIPVPLLSPGGSGSANVQPPPSITNENASSFLVLAQAQINSASGPPADIGIQLNIRRTSDDAIVSMFAFWGIAAPTQYDAPYTFLWPYVPYSGELKGGPGGSGQQSSLSDLGDGSGYAVSFDAYTVGAGTSCQFVNSFLMALAGSFFAPAGTLQSGVAGNVMPAPLGTR